MNLALGIAMVVLGLLAWVGQTMAWLAPGPATRLGLIERRDAVEPAFWADLRGEAAWDAQTLWTLPVAGLLLLVDNEAWPHFSLVGGGMYLYFAGRGIFARMSLRRSGQRIGTPGSVTSAIVFLALWGAVALVAIIAGAAEL